jgi:hypothetical protein
LRWRFASLEPQILGVGHGEPIATQAAETIHDLVRRPIP